MRRAARAWIPALLIALLVMVLAGCGHLPGAAKPVWEQPPPPVQVGPILDLATVHRSTLENGLTVIIVEDDRLPRFDLGITVRRGAGTEAAADAGLASFTAELMERGAGDRTALELAAVVDALGAGLSTGASWDSMSVAVGGLSIDLETLFDVLADVVLRPRFDADEAERVRAETLQALESAKDDPATLARWAFSRALYPEHRYGVPVSGSPDTVAKFDRARARALHGAMFVPANAILYAAGDVEPDALLTLAREHFGAWTAGEVPAPGPPPGDRTVRRIVVVDRPEAGQAQIRVGHDGISRTDERRLAAALANNVLGGGGFSSRLMTKIRAEAGLTYGVRSAFSLRRHPGPFAIGTFTRVAEVRSVVDLVLAELARIASDPPSDDEVARAKSQQAGGFALGLETSTAVVTSLVDLDVYGLPEDSLDTFRARVAALTVADVDAQAQRLDAERASIVVVGPADEIVPLLDGLGEIAVVEP